MEDMEDMEPSLRGDLLHLLISSKRPKGYAMAQVFGNLGGAFAGREAGARKGGSGLESRDRSVETGMHEGDGRYPDDEQRKCQHRKKRDRGGHETVDRSKNRR